MPQIEGVNVSSVMNRQMKRIGNKRARVTSVLKRLGRGESAKGKRVGGTEAREVVKAAKASRSASGLYALQYDEDGNNIYYYRTGAEEEDAPSQKLRLNAFKKNFTDASVWCILLGQFNGGGLSEPGHDNRPDGFQDDDEAEGV